ncbi:glycosyltransferase [Methylocapsa aurea]|uniref:glycosyltransferase n=1 Tax=Methylocapsa aurea TaxID=663610 RepID=UPI00138E42C7|nr:glycosyltransferase [Methylocapsa aurea]
MNTTGLTLSPEAGVERRDGRFVATSTEPWLRIEPHAALQPGKIVKFVYRLSLWDEPARPVFRFWTSDGNWRDQIAPGPIAGAAIWTGRIPTETVRISVSPTNRPGRFDFDLESVSRVSFGALAAKGLRRRPRATLRAVLAGRIGTPLESDVHLERAIGFTPFASYQAWQRARARPIDIAGIDAPRSDWTIAAKIHLVVDAATANLDELAATIAALRAQAYPHWRLHLAGGNDLDDLPADPRIGRLPRESAAAMLRALPGNSFIGAIQAGDAPYPYALAAVAEAAARSPETQVFYGDEDVHGAGRKRVPVLKPGWSPLLQTNRPYLGHAAFLRREILVDWTDAEAAAFVASAEIPRNAAARFAPDKVHSLRRVLLTRAAPWPDAGPPPPEPSPAAIALAGNPAALIIIPTRDQALLLSRCLASIFSTTSFNNFSIIIVDNGSVEPEAQQLFKAFRGDRIVSVLRCPGPFNHSSLCNAAAARRKADVLVFLSEATEILAPDWLDRLVAHALSPDAGAVGALILDRGRRIFDAGLALGIGGDARPFGAGAAAGSPGWLSRNEAAHEVSGVSKACLAVARRKFMLVGGFDAEHLPVEHNDSDLCLKLAERGWTARIDPKVRLLHAGPDRRDALQHGRADSPQRAWFQARWFGALRDDPFFHPGLSLSSLDAAFG